jgi:hypothetical protein
MPYLKCSYLKTEFLVNNILWRARCRSTVNSGNACWQPLLGKQHVTCFLCGLTPACYATMGRLRFLQGLFRGNNSQCNSGCFLCGLFTGYIAGQLRGQLVSDGKGHLKSQLAAKQRVQQLRVHELRGQWVTSECSGRAAVLREELQANGSCDIGRQAEWRYSVKTRQVW